MDGWMDGWMDGIWPDVLTALPASPVAPPGRSIRWMDGWWEERAGKQAGRRQADRLLTLKQAGRRPSMGGDQLNQKMSFSIRKRVILPHYYGRNFGALQIVFDPFRIGVCK
jgi:hypothetical protein